MRKLAMVAAAGLAMVTASVVSNGHTSAIPSSDIRVSATHASPARPQQAPAAPESKAIREGRAESAGRPVRYSRGIPAAIKNRAGGERAHRRWRKAKAAGRNAA